MERKDEERKKMVFRYRKKELIAILHRRGEWMEKILQKLVFDKIVDIEEYLDISEPDRSDKISCEGYKELLKVCGYKFKD